MPLWLNQNQLWFYFIFFHLSTLADTDENLQVHVDQADEGEHPGGEGGVPDQAQCVPEDEVGVTPGGARIHLICPVILSEGDLHKLGRVEREGEDSHGDDIDKEPLAVAHGLGKGNVKFWTAS